MLYHIKHNIIGTIVKNRSYENLDKENRFDVP